MNEEMVEVFEIWKPTDIDTGEAYNAALNTNMEIVALIVNGDILKLKEDYYIEKRYISEKESTQLTKDQDGQFQKRNH